MADLGTVILASEPPKQEISAPLNHGAVVMRDPFPAPCPELPDWAFYQLWPRGQGD